MTNNVDVAIVGAGPYGLSLSAYLNAAGVENRIFGKPMQAWENNMPPGMCLKSYGESSDLFEPKSSYRLEEYSRQKGLHYHDSQLPVKLETFIDYGKAFQQRLVPQVEQKQVIALNAANNGYQLTLDNGETLLAKRVVLGIGIVPFKFLPPNLANLPEELVKHSSAYGPLDSLDGKDVTIIGSGSSAFDLAALLSKRNARVTIVSRSLEPHFQSPPHTEAPTLWRRIYQPDANGLGAGWLLKMCSDTPQLFHLLPDGVRNQILSTKLGPSGGYFIREQVEKHVAMKMGYSLESAEERGGRVQLSVIKDGRREVIDSDHIIASTGYRIDVRRLTFLSDSILQKLATIDNTPILTGNFESSLPGLHFIGVVTGRSFGPVMRFVVGARHPAQRLTQLFSKKAAASPQLAPSAARS